MGPLARDFFAYNFIICYGTLRMPPALQAKMVELIAWHPSRKVAKRDRPMKRRDPEAAVMQVLALVSASVVLGVAGWCLSVLLLARVCGDLYRDDAIVLFGNPHLGIFATIVPYLPIAAGALAMFAPWGLLAAIENRRKTDPSKETMTWEPN
ncbi:MAG TPA: hypothetical protein VGF55_17130 [Gemmataceae bacterium]|jgi:hypothetical protein